MLVITNNGQTEPLINIKNPEVTEAINDDSQEFSFRFSTFLTDKNKYGYDLLQEESIVDLDGQEFRIKQLNEIRNYKDAVGLHVFFDLVETRKYDIYGGSHTTDEIFTWMLDGTGWTFEVIEQIDAALFDNFGENSVLALIWQACKILGCEIRILPGRHIEIYKQIGSETDNQFRFKNNIKTLKKSVDTTNLFTAIKGFGAAGLEVTYISSNADQYVERWAEPLKDDRYTSSDSLTKALQQKLQDEPILGYEVEVAKLDFDVSLGDRLWTIYEPMNIDIRTRVMAKKWFPFTKKSPTVTIGNKKKTFTDVLTETKIEINENQKEYRSKIEQTNDHITLEVDRLDGDISDANAQIQINAEAITSKVSKTDYNGNTITSMINQTATTIDIEADKINFVGHVFGQDATFTGDISGGTISSNTTINVTTDAYVGNNIYLGANFANTTKSLIFTGHARINTDGDFGLWVSASSFRVDGSSTFQSNLAITGTNHLDFSSYGGGWYMQDTTWIRAVGNKNIYTPGTVKATTFDNTSLSDYKENITLFTDYALDSIASTNVYRYNYKKEYAPTNWEVRKTGFLYDEVHPYLQSGEDAIDLYGITAFLWKGEQELYKAIKDLQTRVAALEGSAA